MHPIRWPGSVHRKGEPKLARIVELNEDAEIDLGDALEALEAAAAARGIDVAQHDQWQRRHRRAARDGRR